MDDHAEKEIKRAVDLVMSCYLGERCKFCLREYKTLDDLYEAVWAGRHEHGWLACKNCWELEQVYGRVPITIKCSTGTTVLPSPPWDLSVTVTCNPLATVSMSYDNNIRRSFTKDEWIEKAWPILRELTPQCTDCEFYLDMLELTLGKLKEGSE